jgi:hypothetical protein
MRGTASTAKPTRKLTPTSKKATHSLLHPFRQTRLQLHVLQDLHLSRRRLPWLERLAPRRCLRMMTWLEPAFPAWDQRLHLRAGSAPNPKVKRGAVTLCPLSTPEITSVSVANSFFAWPGFICYVADFFVSSRLFFHHAVVTGAALGHDVLFFLFV